MSHPDFNAKQQIMEFSSAFILSRAIHVAAELGIADHLVEASLAVDTLATRVQANPSALHRLMRFLASYGIFHENNDMTFTLTKLATPLLSGHQDSLRAWLMHHDGNEWRWRAYGNMLHSVQTGEPAFNHIFGTGYFDFISQDQSKATAFDEGMKNLSSQEDANISQIYDFTPHATIVDIGGGKGSLITEILTRHLHLTGIIYDLPHVEPSAQEYLQSFNLKNKVTFKAGSFFETIPCNADIYVLKRILHDWNNEKSLKILQACKKEMKPGATLLIIDAIVAKHNERDFAKDIDIAMLILFGGQERTLTEWESLLEKADLHLQNIYKTDSLVSIMEITA